MATAPPSNSASRPLMEPSGSPSGWLRLIFGIVYIVLIWLKV
jgi:hypothetical protein